MSALRAVLAAGLLAGHPLAHASAWLSVPARSTLQFSATYQGLPVRGTFHRFDVRWSFRPSRPRRDTLWVQVFVTSADMESHDINRTIEGPIWFDARAFPQAVYIAHSITQPRPGHYLASGILRLKGISKPVRIPFTWRESGDSGTLAGTLTLRRTEFGIGTGQWASNDPIGLDVVVTFHVRLRHATSAPRP
ncbi:MAG: YceI family protein [Betaproteobacteria bacterium]|nr:YceI family protein [Betaproteobacteria bacterium]